MKIVQINSVCGVGSTGRIAVDLSEVMNKNQIENLIIYGVGESSYANSMKFGNTINIRSHQIQTRLFGKHGFYSTRNTYKIVNFLKAYKPDIVHLHNIHGHYLNVGVLFHYFKENKIKVIWTFHDCWPFTGHCAYFDIANCYKWKSGCHTCPQKKEYPITWFLDRSKDNWNSKKMNFTNIENLTIVTPSDWLKKLVRQSYFKDFPIKVINNGIDLNIFKPTKSDLREKYNLHGKFVILGIFSVLNDRKGGKYLIDLANKLQKEIHVVILGLSIPKEDLPQNVSLLERTNNTNELAQIYSMVDVFVNPTLEDNFPTVNLESLACGTPIVTFSTGGSPESIDENTGIVVDKDINELIRAVLSIKSRGKAFYTDNCVKKARDLYCKHKKYEEYIELYKETMGGCL